ncbi:hypothetical protein RF11_01012 [Thelohanellus kitauei]|uniref:POPLD domain-containing protein n=1 Tax=Thelohanellus kitauei TaxID=669202 RepID=A0A0C2IBP0_THEKT|nr:hypothetical protein RF11_01012 [Thelohanellus kitauei]
MKHLMEHVGLVWCHPLMTQDICNCLQISNIDGLKIETVYNVSRLRLVGPLSMEAILTLIDPRDQSEFGLTCKSFEKHLVSCDILENGRIFGLPIRCKTIKKHYGSFYKTMGSKSTEKPDSGLLDSLKVPDGLVDSLLSFAGSEFEDFPVLMVVKRESNKKDKIKDSSIILKSNVPQGLPSGLSTGIDIICPRIAAKQVLNFLVFHGANIGGLREYRTVGLESFSRQYPEDYPNTCDLKTIELKPINVSNRKLLKRLKKIDTYYKKIQQLLINLSGSNSFSINGSQSAIVGTCSEQEQDFIFVGLVMDSKGVPTRLDPIYNIKTEVADLNLEEGDKEANFEIVGHVTDGDMSLSMGRGVGKGVVLTKHWNSFQEIKQIKRGYIKASNGAFYKCKLFIINKYFL